MKLPDYNMPEHYFYEDVVRKFLYKLFQGKTFTKINTKKPFCLLIKHTGSFLQKNSAFLERTSFVCYVHKVHNVAFLEKTGIYLKFGKIY